MRLIDEERRRERREMIIKTSLKILIILSIIQSIFDIETGLILLALCTTNLIVYNQVTK